MAMLDDSAFLLFHTKSAFITSDETGSCELVMENEDLFSKVEKQRSFSFLKKERRPSSSIDYELSHSPDIFPDMHYDGRRGRSDTAQRLEKLLIEKQKLSKIQRITWKSGEGNDVNYAEIFEEKEVQPISERKPVKSMLSQQIQEFNTVAAGNLFGKYAKFDGRSMVEVNSSMVKKFDIFLTMAPPGERGFVMTVVTVLNAKIRDLIGLICWQYSIEKREPRLKQDVNLYDLYMAEDNGDVDQDFPHLDAREPVTKFDFGRLALVEKTSGTCHDGGTGGSGPVVERSILKPSKLINKSSKIEESAGSRHSVIIHMPTTGLFVLDTKDPSKSYKNVGDLLSEAVVREKTDGKYHLERSDKPGVTLDLDLDLCQLEMNDLQLVANSNSSHSTAATYTVNMLQKFRPSVEVYLVISDKKIEVYQMKQSVSFSSKSIKQIYLLESLIDCHKISDKHPGDHASSTFRIVVKLAVGKTKQKTFVCDSRVTDDIVARLNKLLHSKSSKISFRRI